MTQRRIADRPAAGRPAASRVWTALLLLLPALAFGFLVTGLAAGAMMEPGRYGLAAGATLLFRAALGGLACAVVGALAGWMLPRRRALLGALVLSLAALLAGALASRRAEARRVSRSANPVETTTQEPKQPRPTTVPVLPGGSR